MELLNNFALLGYDMPFFNFGNFALSNPFDITSIFQFNNFNYTFPTFNYSLDFNSLWQNMPQMNFFGSYQNTSKNNTSTGTGITKSQDVKEIGAELYKKCQNIARKRGLTEEFFIRTAEIAKKINCDPLALLAKMYASSGFKTNKPNQKSGAIGLNQFLPDSKYVKAAGGASAYAKLSALQQLDYIEQFFVENTKVFNGKYLEGEDIFAINFLPSRATQDVLVKSRQDKYYDSKRDKDNDGDIDKKDLRITYQEKLKEMLNCS